MSDQPPPSRPERDALVAARKRDLPRPAPAPAPSGMGATREAQRHKEQGIKTRESRIREIDGALLVVKGKSRAAFTRERGR